MSEDKNLNNKTEKGFERFEEFMDNNSFEIKVEPMDIPTASAEEPDEVKAEPEKAPEAEVKEPAKKAKGLTPGMVALLTLILIVGGIIAIVFSVKISRANETAHRIWERQFEDKFTWDQPLTKGVNTSNYASLSKEKQLEVDYKILLQIAEDKDGDMDGYTSRTPADYDRAVKSYLRFSKGGLQSRKDEILAEFDKIKGKSDQYDLEWIADDINDEDYEEMAIKFITTIPIVDHNMDGFFIEIADHVYKDEMIEGCVKIIADAETGNTSVSRYANRARSYLRHAEVKSIPDLIANEKKKMGYGNYTIEYEIHNTTDESNEVNETNGSSSTDSSSSGSSSGSGSSGRWNPNSGSGTGGSGTLSNSGSGSGSGSFGAGSGKTPKTNPNGWADYDEGYDDVMYNDEYDEERYQTDSEYASGVDDARDEYEEVYGEEFD